MTLRTNARTEKRRAHAVVREEERHESEPAHGDDRHPDAIELWTSTGVRGLMTTEKRATKNSVAFGLRALVRKPVTNAARRSGTAGVWLPSQGGGSVCKRSRAEGFQADPGEIDRPEPFQDVERETELRTSNPIPRSEYATCRKMPVPMPRLVQIAAAGQTSRSAGAPSRNPVRTRDRHEMRQGNEEEFRPVVGHGRSACGRATDQAAPSPAPPRTS